MNRIRVSKNFYLDEFIDFHTYFSEPDHGLRLVKQKTIVIAQFARDYFDKSVTINNWWKWYQETGGHDYPNKPTGIYDMRGYRPPDDPYQLIYGVKVPGARKSTHRTFDALDYNISGMMTQEVYEAIKKEKKFFDIGIRRMENISVAKSWIHNDTKPTGLDHIYIFMP